MVLSGQGGGGGGGGGAMTSSLFGRFEGRLVGSELKEWVGG